MMRGPQKIHVQHDARTGNVVWLDDRYRRQLAAADSAYRPRGRSPVEAAFLVGVVVGVLAGSLFTLLYVGVL